MNEETWTAHPIQTKGRHTHWGINGSKGRIVDVRRAVPNYTLEEQDEHAKLIAAVPELIQLRTVAMAAQALSDIIENWNGSIDAHPCIHDANDLLREALTRIGKPADSGGPELAAKANDK